MAQHIDPLGGWDPIGNETGGLGEHSLYESYYLELQRGRTDLATLRAMLDTSNDAIFLAQVPSGRLVDTNDPACDQLGYTREELLRKPLHEIADFSKSPAAMDLLLGVKTESGGEKISTVLHRRDGKDLPVDIRLRLVTAGNESYAVVAARGVCDHKFIEEDRSRLANYVSLLLDSTDEGIYGLDLQARCTLVNKAGGRMTGYALEELVGKNIHETIHHSRADGSPYPVDQCPILRAIRVGQGVRIDSEVFWRKDGNSFPVEYSSYPIIEDGEVKGAVVSFIDITERKQAEEDRARLAGEQAKRAEAEDARRQIAMLLDEVQRRAAELDAIIASLPDALLIYDQSGEITRMNPAGRSLFRYSRRDLHKPVAERLRPLHAQTPEGKPFQPEQLPGMRALRGETVSGLVMVLHRTSGQAIWVSGSAVPIRGPDGGVTGAVATFTDITALHQLEEQREDFVNAVSHDLRSPLAVIQGQAQLLQRAIKKSGVDGNELQGTHAIIKSAHRMSTMIRDLVDSIRFESGQLKLALEPLDLRLFVTDLKNRLPGLKDPELIRVAERQDLPPVAADPDRLERVLVNLLGNAIKYSPEGSEITVTFNPVDYEVETTISDRGMGIPAKELPHLFERYYRATKAREQREGLGLGLYISRMIVEAHGGRIWAESQIGIGSSFHFTLPVA